MSESAVNTKSEKSFLPAAGWDWLLPLYDPFVKLLGGEAARKQLVEQAQLQPGHNVLDVGCGTGTLAILTKQLHPGVALTGLDPDPKALASARSKAGRARVSVQFDQGFGDHLPYPVGIFDRVFSSLMYHHVPAEQKGALLKEVYRVLKPGGEFHLCDFEAHEGGMHDFLLRISHPKDRLKDNTEERVLRLMEQAGFSDCRKTGRRSMFVGMVAYYSGKH
ncbi:MAG TPA: class I SAM-dependent methyltransferase [Terriglobales bacterium]|nr:class I SAM-dependent methyltransferase [Terriglobales bacterium]